MKTIRYGLIGFGMMGREHIANIQLLEDTEIVAIFEPDAAMRVEAAKLAPQVMFCESLEKLLRLAELDCLVITSPCLLYTSPSPRDATLSRMPSSA